MNRWRRALLSAPSPYAVLAAMPPIPRAQAMWMQFVIGETLKAMQAQPGARPNG